MKLKTKNFSFGFMAVVLSLAYIVSFTQPAMAITSIGPDPADYTYYEDTNPNFFNPEVFYATSHITNMEIHKMFLKLYFPTNTVDRTISIEHADLCANDSNYDVVTQASGPDYTAATRYDLIKAQKDGTLGTKVISPPAYGRVDRDGDGVCVGKYLQLHLKGSDLVYSSDVKYYVAFFRALVMNTTPTDPSSPYVYGQNVFRVRTPGDGLVGFQGGTDPRDFGLEVTGIYDHYANFNNKFGSDCSVETPGYYPLRWYDSDNGTSGIQPVKMKFSVYDDTDKRFLLKSEFTLDSDSHAAYDGSLPDRALWIPNDGTNQYGHVNFLAKPGHKYRWIMYGVYDNNAMQFTMPFDSIFYIKPCDGSKNMHLTPQIKGPSDVLSIGDTATFNFYVHNGPFSDKEAHTDYKRWVKRDDGTTIADSTKTGQTPYPINPSETKEITPAFSQPVIPIWGSKICAYLQFAHTREPGDPLDEPNKTIEKCVRIAKKPLMHVLGGDIWSGGNWATADNPGCKLPDGATGDVQGVSTNRAQAGTWGEYGLLALGNVTAFGSSSRVLRDGEAAGTTFTFSNQSPFGNLYQGLDLSHCLTDVFALYQKGSSITDTEITQSDFDNGAAKTKVVKTDSLNVSVKLGNIPKGRTWVVYATNKNATVSIDSNIKDRDSGYGSISQLSRVIILSNKNIRINRDVTRVDAWLAAKNNLNTCDITGNLSTSDCNKQLVINGPVTTMSISLRRTAGAEGTADPDRRRPAEVFNLREDYFLSLLGDRIQNGLPTTTYEQELPPRY